MALRLVCTYNIANRGWRCNLCDTFEPDTLEYIITRCVYLSECREDFIQSTKPARSHARNEFDAFYSQWVDNLY